MIVAMFTSDPRASPSSPARTMVAASTRETNIVGEGVVEVLPDGLEPHPQIATNGRVLVRPHENVAGSCGSVACKSQISVIYTERREGVATGRRNSLSAVGVTA
jgi:hypothetical protein